MLGSVLNTLFYWPYEYISLTNPKKKIQFYDHVFQIPYKERLHSRVVNKQTLNPGCLGSDPIPSFTICRHIP